MIEAIKTLIEVDFYPLTLYFKKIIVSKIYKVPRNHGHKT